MALITFEHIENALDKIDNLDDAALEQLSETYTLAQSELVGYLLQAADEYENEELTSYIIYYFCIVSEAIAQAGLKPVHITDDMIDEFHESYMEVLEEYTSEEDPAILDTYVNQPNLIAFFAEELDGEDEDGETLDVEFASQLFIVLAAMAGLYNKSIA